MIDTEVTQNLFQIWGTPGERAGSFLTRTYHMKDLKMGAACMNESGIRIQERSVGGGSFC